MTEDEPINHEDWRLDDDFQVESKFLDRLDEEDQHFLLHCSGMKPCANCGEWVSAKNLQEPICNLCAKSETHAWIRGGTTEASENYRSLEALVKRLEELTT